MTTAFFIVLGLATGPLLVLLALLMSGHKPEPKRNLFANNSTQTKTNYANHP